jgi:hypothetical protein
MATTSFTALRRFAGFAFTLLLCGFCLSAQAAGQGTAPLVSATSAAGLSHPTGWGAIQQTAIDSNGDWLVVDYSNGALYEFPAGGGAAITLAAPGATGEAGSLGQGNNPGIAIDPNNNLYIEANWNNCLLMFPWNAATQTWTGLTTMTLANPNTAICTNSGSGNGPNAWAQYGISGYSQGYYQPWGIAIGNNSNLVIGSQSSGNYIFNLGVNNAWTSPTVNTVTSEPISSMKKRPISVAQDPEGNIYFVEDSGGFPGVYEIPTGSSELADETGLTRVDPMLPSASGVITDSAGNLYISDSTEGVFMVPNPSGTPQTSAAVMLTSVPAQGEVSIDWTRNILYVPTTQAQPNGQADVAEVRPGYAELGSSPVGTQASPGGTVTFGFNGSATPAKFVIVEAGTQKPDFAINGGTCAPGTAYAAQSGCQENISLTPTAVGSVSAKLLMLDASNNVLASLVLHGTGVGSNVQSSPATESTFGSGLKTPTQIVADAAGNVYVADAGLGKVLMYAAGSGASSSPVSIGTGLTSPTGVAVDGAGDVFIADSSSGSIYEVPFGPTGLNTAGQVTLVGGLGTSGLSLAVDGLGNLYVADPSKGRVVKLTAGVNGPVESLLTTGFTAPSAVAVDESNNLYVVDGANLFELAGGSGTPTAWLSNLSGATGLAVDPSGAVYISSAAGTTRIPWVGGTLVSGSQTAIASDVSNVSSVALDRYGNVYLTPAAGPHVTVVSTNSTLTLPSPSTLTASTSSPVTVTNTGNAPLLITGYTNSTSTVDTATIADFTAADGTCVGDSTSPATGVPAGGTCTAEVTFTPGPGEQGTLSGTIGITSNAVNAPLTVSASGTALALGVSAASISVSTTAQVTSSPLTVTISPKAAGGPVPTGTIALSYQSWTAPSGTIVPVTVTVSATLDSNGVAKFDGTENPIPAPVLAGTQTFTVGYLGDRVYGRATATTTATVAKSAITSLALPVSPDPADINLPFVLEQDGSTPYDGSQQPWQYNFQITVNAPAGIPTGTLTFMDNSSTCPPGTSANGIGTATCALTAYSGVACPQNAGAAVLSIENAAAGKPSAQASFPTSCMQMLQNTTYTPVISTHYITPVYSGDANFLGLTGVGTLFQVVRSPAVQITTSSASSLTTAPSLSVQSGSSASITLNLNSILGYGIAGRGSQLNDYNFPVSLACDNLPPHSACTFSYPNPDANDPNAVDIPCPASATTSEIAGGAAQCTPGQVTVTINTNITVGTTAASRYAGAASVTFAAIYGFGMIGLFFKRRAFQKKKLLTMIVLMIAGGVLAGSLTACSTTNLSPEAKLATPSGSYAVTITAQQVGSQTINLSNGSVEIYGSQNQVSLPFFVNVTVQ